MIELPILDKNDSWQKSRDKLEEESKECLDKINLLINNYGMDKREIASEALDVIQVCIGILDKLDNEGVNVRLEVAKHLVKLSNRGWGIKGSLLVDKS